MAQLIDRPTEIKACGNKEKIIKEFVGRINSGTDQLSIARMASPQGWVEPGQIPEFDEYTIVLEGALHVNTQKGAFDVHKGQAIICSKGEWVQYSSPYEGGAQYIAICVPAFSQDTVHRDQ